MYTIRFAELAETQSLDLGSTEWVEIDQPGIDGFAEVTGDSQWIHVDVERAAAGPYGRTIAHGFLLLSMVAGAWHRLISISDAPLQLNYGLDRVRFVSPVPVGSLVRVASRIVGVAPIDGGLQLSVSSQVEIKDAPRPAVAAESIYRVQAP